jgi:hypothetical protein
MTWRTGMQAHCININGWENWKTIREGDVYTVKGVTELHGLCALHLEEVPSVCGLPYYACRFRPLVETDISIFTAMLEPSKVPA